MKKSFLLIIFCVVAITSLAQTRTVFGYAIDKSNKEILEEVRATLYRADSTVVDTSSADKKSKKSLFYSSFFRLKVPQPGKYIVGCTAFGYNTVYKNIVVRDSKRSNSIEVGAFYLTRDRHVLNEVVVTATKVKMLVRGDTVVYNADAFQLSEGSMLEALVKQLPGVQLKSDGKIMVNGKFVESLYINGKDFFKGDPKVALENLPSYMVNKVRVYSKKDEMSGMRMRKKDDHLVMDVNLKKQYSIGMIANIGAGRGSDNRYTGRLFALRFTPNSRLSVIGNVNNVNDTQQPGEYADNWTPSNVKGGGLQSVKSGGLSYRYDNDKSFYAESDNTISRTDADNLVNTASETFLTSGNAFSRSRSNSRSKNTTFSSMNMLNYHSDYVFFDSSLMLNYSHSNSNSNDLSGSFSADPMTVMNGNVLDSLFLPQLDNRLKLITSNRRRQVGLSLGRQLSTSINTSFRLVTDSQTKDGLSVNANFSYANSRTNNYSQSALDYPSSATALPDNRNQYTHAPNNSYNFSFSSSYEYFLRNDAAGKKGDKMIMFSPTYRFRQSYNSTLSSLYRLDKLSGWGSRALGILPSTTDSLLLAIDAQNSYQSNRHETQHQLSLDGNLYWVLGSDSVTAIPNLIGLRFSLGSDYSQKSMNYRRNAKYFPISRRDFFFNPSISLSLINQTRGMLSLNYQMSSSSPELTSLVDITDNVDPLNIMLGNPDLKNAHSHSIQLQYNKFGMKNMQNLSANIGYHLDRNAVAMGFVYNKATGVRTSKPENVNGNWGINANVDFSRPLDKKKYLTLNTSTSADNTTSVDLMSVAGSTSSSRSTVHNLNMVEKVSLYYRRNSKLMIGAQFTGTWNHATSQREDFETVSAFDFNYGMTTQAELPLKLQFSSDITMFSRRGYQDSRMNTNELVWNARLSRQLLHGNLTLMADAFDILANLSNVQRTLNAQGRVETYYNVIPRYVMFHAIYRFNRQPKKK